MNYKKFVRVWLRAVEEGKGHDWIARQLGGVSKGVVNARASYLRRKGVQLPQLAKGAHSDELNVEQLNNIIKGASNE